MPKVVQVVNGGGSLMALCDDGSMWICAQVQGAPTTWASVDLPPGATVSTPVVLPSSMSGKVLEAAAKNVPTMRNVSIAESLSQNRPFGQPGE